MIRVIVRSDYVEVSGHANYAELGKDIICAAVSALTFTLLYSLESLSEDLVSATMNEGHMKIEIKNVSEQGKLLIDSFFIGITAIAKEYGEKYIQIQ